MGEGSTGSLVFLTALAPSGGLVRQVTRVRAYVPPQYSNAQTFVSARRGFGYAQAALDYRENQFAVLIAERNL
jgi:hypothetical protein